MQACQVNVIARVTGVTPPQPLRQPHRMDATARSTSCLCLNVRSCWLLTCATTVLSWSLVRVRATVATPRPRPHRQAHRIAVQESATSCRFQNVKQFWHKDYVRAYQANAIARAMDATPPRLAHLRRHPLARARRLTQLLQAQPLALRQPWPSPLQARPARSSPMT